MEDKRRKKGSSQRQTAQSRQRKLSIMKTDSSSEHDCATYCKRRRERYQLEKRNRYVQRRNALIMKSGLDRLLNTPCESIDNDLQSGSCECLNQLPSCYCEMDFDSSEHTEGHVRDLIQDVHSLIDYIHSLEEGGVKSRKRKRANSEGILNEYSVQHHDKTSTCRLCMSRALGSSEIQDMLHRPYLSKDWTSHDYGPTYQTGVKTNRNCGTQTPSLWNYVDKAVQTSNDSKRQSFEGIGLFSSNDRMKEQADSVNEPEAPPRFARMEGSNHSQDAYFCYGSAFYAHNFFNKLLSNNCNELAHREAFGLNQSHLPTRKPSELSQPHCSKMSQWDSEKLKFKEITGNLEKQCSVGTSCDGLLTSDIKRASMSTEDEGRSSADKFNANSSCFSLSHSEQSANSTDFVHCETPALQSESCPLLLQNENGVDISSPCKIDSVGVGGINLETLYSSLSSFTTEESSSKVLDKLGEQVEPEIAPKRCKLDSDNHYCYGIDSSSCYSSVTSSTMVIEPHMGLVGTSNSSLPQENGNETDFDVDPCSSSAPLENNQCCQRNGRIYDALSLALSRLRGRLIEERLGALESEETRKSPCTTWKSAHLSKRRKHSYSSTYAPVETEREQTPVSERCRRSLAQEPNHSHRKSPSIPIRSVPGARSLSETNLNLQDSTEPAYTKSKSEHYDSTTGTGTSRTQSERDDSLLTFKEMEYLLTFESDSSTCKSTRDSPAVAQTPSSKAKKHDVDNIPSTFADVTEVNSQKSKSGPQPNEAKQPVIYTSPLTTTKSVNEKSGTGKSTVSRSFTTFDRSPVVPSVVKKTSRSKSNAHHEGARADLYKTFVGEDSKSVKKALHSFSILAKLTKDTIDEFM